MTEKNVHNTLFAPLKELEAYPTLLGAVGAPGVVGLYGPEETQRAHIIAGLVHDTGRTAIVVTANEPAAQRMAEDLSLLLGGGARALTARDVSFLKTAASGRELSIKRLEVMGECVTGRVRVLVVSADVLMERLMPRERFAQNVLRVEQSMQLDPTEFMEKLTKAGYERVQLVEARGQCALRGGILDVYPVGESTAMRIEFFDDEVDSIRSFDVMTQRSISNRDSVVLYPAAEFVLTAEESAQCAQSLKMLLAAVETQDVSYQKRIEEEFNLIPFDEFLAKALPDEEKGLMKSAYRGGVRSLTRSFSSAVDALQTGRRFEGEDSLLPVLLHAEGFIADYLDNPFMVLDTPERLRERCENRMLEFKEQFTQAMEREQALRIQADLLQPWETLLGRFSAYPVILANSFLRTEKDFRPRALAKIEARNAPAYQANLKELAADLLLRKQDGWRIALLAGGKARGERLVKALYDLGVTTEFAPDFTVELESGKPLVFPTTLGRGFVYPELHIMVFSEGDIYGVNRRRAASARRAGSKIEAFTELKIGDYVVHENHGIGQYMGTVRLASEGTYRDYLHIRYQGADKLYVPTDQLDRVQKYIGSEGESPKLNRLSGSEWQKQKGKVKQSIRAMADDLLKLYAKREASVGYAFDPDTPWQREFEDNFPYEETPDQIAAIEDIKKDMESTRTMDRLLCGDVGYGKTEVALRAIFKAVMSGKQAALLAPTTILVQQHYATIVNRFGGFPVRVESISRFKTAAEQKKIIKQLENGEIDVIVGTHRLLGKDIVYKDLGLLVVDEEQRFGVTHKEAIKKLKENIDVLTLTATPIPRTLHMSMVGIRDMSLLQSPPEERYPVQTYVVEYSDGLIRDAILREVGRGGQVYVLHNRVQTIEVMYARLQKLVPEARIAIGHGQMREHALEDVMLDFYDGKYDVLLCTTIIESGLDVPRANTLIVCDADRFGLSQLYQIRGRVGRSNRLAYAYFTVSPNKVLTETADKRLSTIREFTEFGSGFRVAMRDLEIRGAGNLLGSEQSGFMASVGYDMYVKMVEQTIKELRGDVSLGDIETRVDVKMDAYLPAEYISNDLRRIEMYKKIATVRSTADCEDLTEELIDRFGDPPKCVLSLLDISRIKNDCSRLGIDFVSVVGEELRMRFSISANIDFMRVLQAIRRHPELKVKGGNPPTLTYFKLRATPEELVQSVVKILDDVLAEYTATPEAK